MLRFTSTLFAVVVLLAVALPAQAEERIALVIGNGAYEAVPTLPNAPIDTTLMAAAGMSDANPDEYVATVSKWTSDKDVGAWLDDNFIFSKSRQNTIRKRLKNQGPSGLLIRNPETLFKDKVGYCADSAYFALDALRRISPEYNPRWVFVENSVKGKANHWVTGYTVEDKLYIIDYGAGHSWDAMNGIHGPYDSLEDYKEFLASLKIRGFKVADVMWRDMPGELD